VDVYDIYQGQVNPQVEGTLGDNLLSLGIWEIDFKHHRIIFTSSIDSLHEEIKNAQLIPARFTKKGIELEVVFRENSLRNIQLDLGCNAMIIIPSKDFFSLEAGNKGMYTDSSRFSTPASSGIVENTHVFDTITLKEIALNTS
jgi:hypothetical protein